MMINFWANSNILQTFGIFYDRLVHFLFFWYMFPVLVSCTKKNMATLVGPTFVLNPFQSVLEFVTQRCSSVELGSAKMMAA
jgi:hypothetical protein